INEIRSAQTANMEIIKKTSNTIVRESQTDRHLKLLKDLVSQSEKNEFMNAPVIIEHNTQTFVPGVSFYRDMMLPCIHLMTRAYKNKQTIVKKAVHIKLSRILFDDVIQV